MLCQPLNSVLLLDDWKRVLALTCLAKQVLQVLPANVVRKLEHQLSIRSAAGEGTV